MESKKKYFCKYLPVEGEIKEFERAHLKEEIDLTDNKGQWRATVSISDHLSFLFKDKKGYHFCVKKLHGSGTSGITLEIDEFIKVKLFLCSRDIQIGDEYYVGRLEGYKSGPNRCSGLNEKDVWYNMEPNTFIHAEKEVVYKIIGEISSEATWLKEGDEFDEEGVQKLSKLGPDHFVTWIEGREKLGYECVVFIKCHCCGTFK